MLPSTLPRTPLMTLVIDPCGSVREPNTWPDPELSEPKPMSSRLPAPASTGFGCRLVTHTPIGLIYQSPAASTLLVPAPLSSWWPNNELSGHLYGGSTPRR